MNNTHVCGAGPYYCAQCRPPTSVTLGEELDQTRVRNESISVALVNAGERVIELEKEAQALATHRDALLSTLNEVFAVFGVDNVIELAAAVQQIRQDAERWRALAQHSGPAHDAVHAAEQALSRLHRVLHEGLGHPGTGVKT